MQTIKTAAIVVLLMTVIYGAYVSLTTPPEPLPDEVHRMLVATDDFDIDAGFPESLDSFAPPMRLGDSGSAGLSQEVDGKSDDPSPRSAAVESTVSPYGISSSFSDQGPMLPSDVDVGVASDALDGDRLASLEAMVLPAVEGSAPSPTIDHTRDYPTTGDTFDLPEPDEITSNLGLVNAIRAADEQYHAGKKKEALATLSLFYETPNLSPEERTELLSRLDPLAREVIYSKSHLLEQPHRVRQKETLVEIAAHNKVPWQLLANINGIDDPLTVLPGTDLKIVRGPFRGDVSLSQNELTLFLGDYYAGRFPIAVGNDPSPQPGTYTVQDKQEAKTYYDASGNPVPPGSSNNPYGSMWLDLGGQVSVHGSPSPTEPTKKGCISLAGNHAADLYGILSQGSSVVIRR